MANNQNLRLLAEGLKKLPVNYQKFDMDSFYENLTGDTSLFVENINECGTSACAVGHGPTIKGLEAYRSETWREYTERVFGVTTFDETFTYLFGSEWANRDNTIDGAIDRIETYLHSGVPEDWYIEEDYYDEYED